MLAAGALGEPVRRRVPVWRGAVRQAQPFRPDYKRRFASPRCRARWVSMATQLGGDVAERRDQGRRDDQERGQKKRDCEGQAHAVTLARGGHVTWPLAYRDRPV